MSNSSRRKIDQQGNMFIPMNVEGGQVEDSFMTTGKWIVISLTAFLDFVIWLSTTSNFQSILLNIIIFVALLVSNFYVLRYLIFEEAYYYKIFLKMKENEVTTPSYFWGISSINDNSIGALITYVNARSAIIVKIERDTVIGKPLDFKETHYDALSDFYKALNTKEYKYIQMNIMEEQGNDPRLQQLVKKNAKCKNENLKKIMEQQIGYIKNITQNTLYENDYILVYTDNPNRIDGLMQDVIECSQILMKGCYIGYNILNSNEILQLVKNYYNVNYFDSKKAILSMYKNSSIKKNILKIKYINAKDGTKIEYDNTWKNKLKEEKTQKKSILDENIDL